MSRNSFGRERVKMAAKNADVEDIDTYDGSKGRRICEWVDGQYMCRIELDD